MKATEEHCRYCFESIQSSFEDREPTLPKFDNSEYPVFVTWKRAKTLRGCIGSFTPMPLHQGLYKYALASAFDDSRFKPISLKEVKDLTCSLSILHSFENIDDHYDWQIGVHGLRLQYQGYHSVYLPQVAFEQGWSQIETLQSLLSKSGYKGELNDELLKEMKLVRFQSSVASCTFATYLNGSQDY
jgi:AMME syndrome candidate gene 1 protein